MSLDEHDKNLNLDPITDAPGAHPVGTGVGAALGGAAAGAAPKPKRPAARRGRARTSNSRRAPCPAKLPTTTT